MLIIFCIITVLLDQASKYYFANLLADGRTIKILGDFLQFNYAENKGAAFSILQNKQIFLIIITIIVIIVIAYYIKKVSLTFNAKLMLTFIIGGAIGNLIDRIRFRYVIDFIDVKFGTFYDFPIFNIADSFVVVGTIIFTILVFTDNYMLKE
ncbi:signal peptidase II [Clostridiaceae bacterium M8S5]|nr:signal peptidase II [Clostridiaceae bacterium M8S5]